MINLIPSELRVRDLFLQGNSQKQIAAILNKDYEYIRRVMCTIRRKTKKSNQQLHLT